MSYLWEDDDGNVFESPLGDDRIRGQCTGIPECCIDAFIDGSAFAVIAPEHWYYRPCQKCVDMNNRIETKHCGDLKDACICGTWKERKLIFLDEDLDE